MLLSTKFDIKEAVYIDKCKDLVGYVTGFIYRGVSIEYEVSWINQGYPQSTWFGEWRLTKASDSNV